MEPLLDMRLCLASHVIKILFNPPHGHATSTFLKSTGKEHLHTYVCRAFGGISLRPQLPWASSQCMAPLVQRENQCGSSPKPAGDARRVSTAMCDSLP